MKMNTPMQKLMHGFCTRHGISTNAVRFLFDGNRLNETQTPLRLGFENNEIIDVMIEQQGDWPAAVFDGRTCCGVWPPLAGYDTIVTFFSLFLILVQYK
jgi:small ubiquitin-related modifier